MRDAVVEQFDEFLDAVAKHAFHELEPKNVVEDQFGSLDDLGIDLAGLGIKQAFRDTLRQDLITMKTSFQEEYRVIVDAAEDGDVDGHREDFLAKDMFYDVYQGPHGDDLRDDLYGFFDRSVEAIAPVVGSDEETFWDAVAAVYTADEARENLGIPFDRSPILDGYRDGLVIEYDLEHLELGMESIEYTDEALRVLAEGERYLREDVIDGEIGYVYGDDD